MFSEAKQANVRSFIPAARTHTSCPRQEYIYHTYFRYSQISQYIAVHSLKSENTPRSDCTIYRCMSFIMNLTELNNRANLNVCWSVSKFVDVFILHQEIFEASPLVLRTAASFSPRVVFWTLCSGHRTVSHCMSYSLESALCIVLAEGCLIKPDASMTSRNHRLAFVLWLEAVLSYTVSYVREVDPRVLDWEALNSPFSLFKFKAR
jgi:hypothetical protein